MTIFLISVALIAAVLIGNQFAHEWKHRKRRHGKPRRPGTDLTIRRVPFGDMLEPRIDPGFWQGDPASAEWEGPGTIRTAKVAGVHLPLSDDKELPPGGTLREGMSGQPLLQEPAGGASPLDALPVPPHENGWPGPGERQARYPLTATEQHYAWLDRQAQNVPRPADEQHMSVGTPRAAGPGHPGFWPQPITWGAHDIPRTMARDHDITVIDSFPRISGGRDCVRPYGYQHERHATTAMRAAITSGAAW